MNFGNVVFVHFSCMPKASLLQAFIDILPPSGRAPCGLSETLVLEIKATKSIQAETEWEFLQNESRDSSKLPRSMTKGYALQLYEWPRVKFDFSKRQAQTESLTEMQLPTNGQSTAKIQNGSI